MMGLGRVGPNTVQCPPLTGALLPLPLPPPLSLSASPELARYLAPNLLSLLSSRSSFPSPLRPKAAAAAALGTLSLSPDSVPILFKPLVDSLSSPEPRIVSTAVGAFAKLASSNDPSPYLPLIPDFSCVLSDSRSNWTLIKLLKIFACLAPLEPRLTACLLTPSAISSSARSLVFEYVRAVFSGLPNHDRAIRLAVDKVREFPQPLLPRSARPLPTRPAALLGHGGEQGGHPFYAREGGGEEGADAGKKRRGRRR